jgi:hypothetical protein
MVSPAVSMRVRRQLMGSLIDELQRREAATREEAEELRGRIAQLSERLAGVEERLSRLVITCGRPHAPCTPQPRTGVRSKHSQYWPETAPGPPPRSAPKQTPPALGPRRRRSHPHPARRHQQWRLRRRLALPPSPGAPEALPRHTTRSPTRPVTQSSLTPHRRRVRAANVQHEQRHGSRAAADASTVHVKPLPFTGRSDSAPRR